jgi:NitT/TauT family transport system permease protein
MRPASEAAYAAPVAIAARPSWLQSFGVRRFVRLTAARLLVLAVVVALWQGVVAAGWTTAFWISTPWAIALQLGSDFASGQIWPHLWATVQSTVSGFALGSVAGIVTGFVLARWQGLHEAVEPYLMALYSMPRVALGPMFVVWFGIGIASKVALAVSIVYFVMVINTHTGVVNVDRTLVNSVRTMGGSNWFLIRKVLLPSTVPWILSGLRISIGFALIGAVVGEMIIAERGLGRLIAYRSGLFDVTGVFAVMVVLAVMAVLFNEALKFFERRLTHWKSQD